MSPALTLDGVVRVHRRGQEEVRAVDGVDLVVEPGEFLAVTGSSGSGKSTLLHLAGGLDRPDEGTVLVGDTDPWAMSGGHRAALRRRRMGFVFQFFHLVPTLSATENVSLPLLLDGIRPRIADARARDLLGRVGLADRAGHRPAEMSGGQMQRVAVARALAASPALLLADEPTGNLDSVSSTEVLDLLAGLAADEGTAVVMVTHDADARDRAGRRVNMADGRLEG